jgi:hypothetical protein
MDHLDQKFIEMNKLLIKQEGGLEDSLGLAALRTPPGDVGSELQADLSQGIEKRLMDHLDQKFVEMSLTEDRGLLALRSEIGEVERFASMIDQRLRDLTSSRENQDGLKHDSVLKSALSTLEKRLVDHVDAKLADSEAKIGTLFQSPNAAAGEEISSRLSRIEKALAAQQQLEEVQRGLKRLENRQTTLEQSAHDAADAASAAALASAHNAAAAAEAHAAASATRSMPPINSTATTGSALAIDAAAYATKPVPPSAQGNQHKEILEEIRKDLSEWTRARRGAAIVAAGGGSSRVTFAPPVLVPHGNSHLLQRT